MKGTRILLWVGVVSLFGLFGALSLQAQQSNPQGETDQNAGAPATVSNAGGTPALPAAGTVVPRLVQFSGAVMDSNGKPATGTVSITFSLYELQEGGTPLWSETQSLALDSQGHYTAFLGAASPDGLPLDLFASGSARWLGVAPVCRSGGCSGGL